MGWFGGPKQQKCPRCGAKIPFVISGGDRSDDLMRRSKLNLGQSGALCSNCMRAAHQATHVPSVPPPPPISQSTEADPEFERSLQTAKRVAAVFGNKIDQADVEKVKARLRERGGDNPLSESLAYQFKNTMRGCMWTLLLAITAFVVFGWLASEDKSTDPPAPVATSAPPIAGGVPVPMGSPGAWLTTADYPESAIRAKVEGVPAGSEPQG